MPTMTHATADMPPTEPREAAKAKERNQANWERAPCTSLQKYIMAKVGQAAWAALAAHMASDEAPSSAQRVRADFVEGERVSCTTRIKPAASAEREKEESSREVAASP